MARNTQNVLVTQNDRGGHRQAPGNAPAVETANARVHTIGPFRKANPTAGLAATAMTLGGVDTDAPTQQLMHSSGRVLAVIAQSNANITAGGASAVILQPQVAPSGLNAANQGTAVNLASGGSNPQMGVTDQPNTTVNGVSQPGFAFAKGDGLLCTIATNGAFAPTTADISVWLVVQYDPSSGVPA